MPTTTNSPQKISRRAALVLPLAATLATKSASAAISPLPTLAQIPDTPAGRELTWILEQVERSADGLTESAIEKHVTPAFLTGLPADQLLAVIQDYVGPAGPLTVIRFEGASTGERLSAVTLNPLGIAWRIRLSVEPDEPNLITQLFFEPVPVAALPSSPPTTWPRLSDAFAALGPRVSFAAAELTESGPRWLVRLHGENQRAIASLFKIYVLGAAVHAVNDSTATWNEPLGITSSAISLPNGDMRLESPGREFPLRIFAERMIAGSDNTATDHLITRLGRAQTWDAFARMNHSNPDINNPLLMTREWFAMRLRMRDSQIERYIDASPANRLRILRNTVDPLADTLSETEPWPGPRFIDQIEWFAGAVDIVRALDWLRVAERDEVNRPARNALSTNPGICWSPLTWSYVGYKGGYETGVMSNAWLLRRHDGRWFTFAGITNDTRKEIDAAGFWALSAVAERLLATTN